MQQKLKGPRSWKYMSSSSEGLHTVVSPDISECGEAWVFRLNLHSGGSAVLESGSLELSGVVISGKLTLTMDQERHVLERFDSFYLPADCPATVTGHMAPPQFGMHLSYTKPGVPEAVQKGINP